ncbi:MAG: MATE family efflux transporter [FCB group bacterium]|jgi:putative MATE family efflux protein|nr:MATE family efflux transporter [FCB group bacterium]
MDTDSAESTPARRPGMRGVDLTTGSVPWHLVKFSIPMLVGSTLHTAYSIINAAWVGNGLGANAMAALTVSFPIFFLLMAVAGGLTLASSILVSQAYGAKDMVRLKRVVQNSLVLTGAVAVFCFVAGQLSAEAVFRAMQTPPDVLPMAVDYFRIFLWTTPFMFGVYFLASVMRGVGDSRSPLYFQAASLVVTAILDPLLMFGLLGLPRLGLNGTAWATIVAQAGAFVSIAIYVQKRDHIAAPDWRRLRLHLPTTILTAKIGIPTMIQQALVSLGMLFIVSMINRYGAHSSAAFGIAMRIDQLAFMPAMTVGMAVSTLAGQNIGAGRFERVHQVFRWGVALSCAITAVASALALSVPAWLIGLFSNDADVIVVGTQYLRIVGLGYLMFAVMFVSNGVINGAGQTAVTTVFTFITFWAVRVPLAAYLSHRMGTVEGIWYAVLASLVVGTVASLAYYLTGRWKKSLVRKIPEGVMAPTPEID